MEHKILLALSILLCVLIIPSASAELVTQYSCDNNYLTVNSTLVYLGDIEYLSFQNISCSPHGCAYNALMCNSPLKVDKGIVALSSILLIVVAIIILWLGNQIKIDKEWFYWIRYLFVLFAVFLILYAILFIGGVDRMTPNNYNDNFTFIFWAVFMLVSMMIAIVTLYEGKVFIEKKIKQGIKF